MQNTSKKRDTSARKVYVVTLSVQTADKKQATALKRTIDKALRKFPYVHRTTVAPPLEAEIEEWQ